MGVRRARHSVQAGQGLLRPQTWPGGRASPRGLGGGVPSPLDEPCRRSPRFWDLGAPGVRSGSRVASQNDQKALSARF